MPEGAPRLYELIDTPPERAFDRATMLAARMLQVPISMVSVVDERRNFFKSVVGLPAELDGASEVPISHSYCRHVYSSGETLVVEETRDHPTVGENPTNETFGIRSYLGVPVRDPAGRIACTLCVLDSRPRRWSGEDREVLETIRETLETELALREEVASRRRTEEHNTLLLREMEHRVKNSLATVQALVSMSLKDAESLADLRRSLPERVASLAQTQAFVFDRGAKGIELRALIEGELVHYAAGAAVSIEADGTQIAPRDALNVGMILHELATNAVKYGALSRNGQLDVSLLRKMSPDGERQTLALDWRERGVEIAEAPRRSGFGSMLLHTLIVRQYGGSLQRQWTTDGLHVSAEFALSPLE